MRGVRTSLVRKTVTRTAPGFSFLSIRGLPVSEQVRAAFEHSVETRRAPYTLNELCAGLGKKRESVERFWWPLWRDYYLRKIDRHQQIAFASSGTTFSPPELAQRLNLPKSEVWKILSPPPSLGERVYAPPPSQAYYLGEFERAVAKWVSSLPARHAELIRMRFGLGGEPPRTLEETAARFRLSSERIRQLEQEIFRGMPPHQKLGLLRLYREAVGIPLVVKPEAKIGQKAREDGILARRRGLKRVHHDVLAYRFGFSGGKPHTLEETARRHRMTRANVWLITNAALKRCLDEGRLTDWQWLQERARQAETRSQRRRESVKCRSRKNR